MHAIHLAAGWRSGQEAIATAPEACRIKSDSCNALWLFVMHVVRNRGIVPGDMI
ncbi:hypothetical protein NXC14_CH00937 [Rhizobium sp. NXC14]|nr:hypothetical protein NXC14_CH00937 [Rhizobium sp. NXC14]